MCTHPTRVQHMYTHAGKKPRESYYVRFEIILRMKLTHLTAVDLGGPQPSGVCHVEYGKMKTWDTEALAKWEPAEYIQFAYRCPAVLKSHAK